METTNYNIQKVTLNVADLEKMTEFYQEIMGLSVLQREVNTVTLGISATMTELLTLERVTTPVEKTSGLYHVAYLLPSREALGTFLRHMLISQYPLQGASDHGYSEALYLADPEGNGIEVYADKPQSAWDIKEDGIIVGVTEPMDAEGVLAAADNEFDKLIPGTFIGHVHLAVSAIPQTNHFFRDILGFTLTTEFGQQAAFYGKDGYHHQFAGNIWGSRHLPRNNELAPGLKDIHVAVSAQVFNETLEKLIEKQAVIAQQATHYTFRDPNGITLQYHLRN